MSFSAVGLLNYIETPTSADVRIWDYGSSFDDFDTIYNTEGYFDPANQTDDDGNLIYNNPGLPLRAGDIIGIIATDQVCLVAVDAVSPNVVVQKIQYVDGTSING